uniref:Uncharacterized protein n=1 Tax=Oryza brachyantha TaxID=4533 RepID=J3MJ18_ORYBR
MGIATLGSRRQAETAACTAPGHRTLERRPVKPDALAAAAAGHGLGCVIFWLQENSWKVGAPASLCICIIMASEPSSAFIDLVPLGDSETLKQALPKLSVQQRRAQAIRALSSAGPFLTPMLLMPCDS